VWSNVNLHFVLLLALLTPQLPLGNEETIRIIQPVINARSGSTNIDGGPVVGDMLNAHLFPGINNFKMGSYSYALEEFNYVIARSQYLTENPRKAEYLSTAHFLRGSIYLYHADGGRRFQLAKSDFEASIEWNPNNFAAYLELSRVYSQLGFKDQALSILQSLKGLDLDESLSKDVSSEIEKVKASGSPPDSATPTKSNSRPSSKSAP